ncbi:unnamed protein product, partial [Prorocentrum cordatum]
DCRDFMPPATKPQVGITMAVRFNQRIQMDLCFQWDECFILVIDEFSKYKVADFLKDRTVEEILSTVLRCWIRYFGPPIRLILDQEGGMVSELASRMCDKFHIRRSFAGTDDHTMTGLVERRISLIRLCSLKLKKSAQAQGLQVTNADIIQEAAMVSNSLVSYGGQTANQAVLGFTPRDYYDMEATTLDSVTPAVDSCPDPFESALRLRMQAKIAMAKSLVEERIARCNRTRQQQTPPGQRLQPGEPVDIYRAPERKDQSGWRGPAELVKLSQGTGIVVWNGIPYILPTRHIRRHAINLEKIPIGDGNHYAYLLQDTTDSSNLTKLMDLVDGTAYGQYTRIGKIFDGSSMTCSPSVSQLRLVKHWCLCLQIYQRVFHLKSVDGLLYGTSVRRIPALDRMRHGLLVTWPRSNKTKYLAQEVRPDKGINITDFSSDAWDVTSFFLMYRTELPVNPFLDDDEIPDTDDLGNIEVWPESMRDIDQDIRDM